MVNVEIRPRKKVTLFFSFLVAKMTLKMTKISKKSDLGFFFFFCRKIFTIIFKYFPSNFIIDFLILHNFSKLKKKKKKNAKLKIWVGQACKTGFSVSMAKLQIDTKTYNFESKKSERTHRSQEITEYSKTWILSEKIIGTKSYFWPYVTGTNGWDCLFQKWKIHETSALLQWCCPQHEFPW